MEGRLVLAVSTPILLEYEEVIGRYSSRARWEDVARMFALISLLHGTIREIALSFRFRTITGDADDDAFADRGGGARDKWRQGPGRAKRLWPMRTSSSPRIITSM